jgi:hypothetical protein
MLLLSNTDAGKLTRKYFISIEQGFNTFIDYTLYINESKNNLLQIKCDALESDITDKLTRLHNLQLERHDKALTLFHAQDNVKGYLYIESSPSMQLNGIYKLGKTSNVKSREANYKTADASIRIYKDYSVNNYNEAERILHKLLSSKKVTPNSSDEFYYASSIEWLDNYMLNFTEYWQNSYNALSDDRGNLIKLATSGVIKLDDVNTSLAYKSIASLTDGELDTLYTPIIYEIISGSIVNNVISASSIINILKVKLGHKYKTGINKAVVANIVLKWIHDNKLSVKYHSSK